MEVPTQVLLLDAYQRLGEKNAKSYGIMALLGLGSSLMNKFLAEQIYNRVHTSDLGGRYFVSPLTAHTYDVAYENYINRVHSESPQEASPDNVLKSANAYSKTYMDIATVSSIAKFTYGTLSSQSSNPLYALLYGITQPMSVILKDQGKIK